MVNGTVKMLHDGQRRRSEHSLLPFGYNQDIERYQQESQDLFFDDCISRKKIKTFR